MTVKGCHENANDRVIATCNRGNLNSAVEREGFLELAPGPVAMRPDVLSLGARQPSYFRTEEFSRWMLSLKAKFLNVLGVDGGYEIIFLTGSGTIGLEAVAANFLPRRRHLSISSGQFGDRMIDMSQRRGFRFDTLRIDTDLSPLDNLKQIDFQKYKSCFLTISETSNGYYIDPKLVRDAGLPDRSLLLCDGVSAAFSDDFDAGCIDALVIGSQKGLGLSPGMCFVVLSPKAVDFVRRKRLCGSLYYDFNLYIDNMARGQTPFTPALNVLYQLDRVLDDIRAEGGLNAMTAYRKALADRFRSRLDTYGIPYIRKFMSNCVTAIQTGAVDATAVSQSLSKTHTINVATNSPPLNKTLFRVSHMGFNTQEDMDRAADAVALAIRECS